MRMNKWITLSIQFDLDATNVEHNKHNGTKNAMKVRTIEQIPYFTQIGYWSITLHTLISPILQNADKRILATSESKHNSNTNPLTIKRYNGEMNGVIN